MPPLQSWRAISRVATPPTNFSRSTSRTWHMVVLSAGIRSLLRKEGARPESASRGTRPRARSSRNGGRHHLGTVGEIISERVGGIIPERRAASPGIGSQKAEGWLLVPDRYDDGGISGATLERPALKRLMADIEARRVDVVVVYKIDRLSRALMDFA